MASSSAKNAPGEFIQPPSFVEHSKNLADWLWATIMGTTEFDAATTKRLRLALVAYSAAARAYLATPDHPKVAIPDILRAAMTIGKDALLINDPRWPTLVSKPGKETSARQDAPMSSKPVPTVDSKGKKRMAEDEHTESKQEGGEEKRRKREENAAFGAGKGKVGSATESRLQPSKTQEVWVEVPPRPYRRADSVKRKENTTAKRVNPRLTEEVDLIRVKREHKASGDNLEHGSEDEENDVGAHASSSRVQRPRRTAKDIGYVEVSDEEPPKSQPPKITAPRRVAHPAPALKPTNTVMIQLPVELSGRCDSCKKNGLMCFTEWNNAKSNQTACGYCHDKKVKCSLTPARSEFMKTDAGQAFYNTVSGKPPKPAPKKRGRSTTRAASTRAASRARSTTPSEAETFQKEGSAPPLKVKPVRKRRSKSKTPKAKYKTPSVVASDTDDYTDAPKAKRVRLVDAKEAEKPAKVTTRAPLSKQSMPIPSVPQKTAASVSHKRGTARPLSAQARRAKEESDATADSDGMQETPRPRSRSVSTTSEPNLQQLGLDILELRREQDAMKLFIKDQQENFREIIQIMKLDIKDLYGTTKRLNSDFAKNYEYTDQNTKAIESIKSTTVSVKRMCDFGAELKEMDNEFAERFERIEGAIDEIMYNNGAIWTGQDDGGTDEEDDAKADEEDGDSEVDGKGREDTGSDEKAGRDEDKGTIHAEDNEGDHKHGEEQVASTLAAQALTAEAQLTEKPVGVLALGGGVPTTETSVSAGVPTLQQVRGANDVSPEPVISSAKPLASNHAKGTPNSQSAAIIPKLSVTEVVEAAEEPPRPSSKPLPSQPELEHVPRNNSIISNMVGAPQNAQPAFSVPTVTVSAPEEMPINIDVAEILSTEVRVTPTGLTVPTPEQIVPSSQEGQDGQEIYGVPKPDVTTTPKEHPPVAELSNAHPPVAESLKDAPGSVIEQISIAEPPPNVVSNITNAESEIFGKKQGGRAPRNRATAGTPTTMGETSAGGSTMNTEVQMDIPRRTRAMTKVTRKPPPKPQPKGKRRKAGPRAESSSLSPPP